ncbi:hypothetical protein ACEZCY_14590 [Streptacidiphilus sp. N1-12]|uniref:Uncharacterized protein n=2 Tax=Streptacidiphilus alkalitolerans TaxID=3342712 RepID=A0ABV6V9T3_9ACTN
MTTPRWGHKPPPVQRADEYWGRTPPAPSERMAYWVRRWRSGEWEPNRWLLRECSDCRAGMLGVWIWEARFALAPLVQIRAGVPADEAAALAARYSDTGPGPYWALLEERSRTSHGESGQDQGRQQDFVGSLATAMAEGAQAGPTVEELRAGLLQLDRDAHHTYTQLIRGADAPCADIGADRWCPCGHPLDHLGFPDLYACISGEVYGPCTSDECGGMCETTAACTAAPGCCAEEGRP